MSIVIPKNPPPPSMATVTMNGFCGVQKSSENVTPPVVLVTNGIVSAALSDMFSRLNIPMATSGIARLRPAVIPLAVTSTKGGSLKASSGRRSFSVSTNLRGPPK